MDKAQLAAKARTAALHAFAPYSGHSAGAAVLASSGKMYGGANIEIAGSTASCCALRVAFARAIAAGERGFAAAAATGEQPGDAHSLCGVCRQTLAEFCTADTPVLLVEADSFQETSVGALLPGWPFAAPRWPSFAPVSPAPDITAEDTAAEIPAETPAALIARAFAGRRHCYAPFSNYYVGAALRASSGRVYTGGNIEPAGRTAVICAERTALFRAVYAGERTFTAIAVVGAHSGTAEADYLHANPCAVCRQALAEFNPGDLVCYLAKSTTDYLTMALDELLPHAFRMASYK